MEALTVTMLAESEDDLRRLDRLQRIVQLYVKRDVRLERTHGPAYASLSLREPRTRSWTGGKKRDVRSRFSRALAHFVVLEQEGPQLRRLIEGEFAFEDKTEADLIAGYCSRLLRTEDEPAYGAEYGREQREQMIAAEIDSLLAERQVLNLDGMLRFRLREYRDELREIVEYAIDEYLMDKQYQEFIALLKYFVFIQKTKTPVAHLIHKSGHDFDLLDENYKPIHSADAGTITVELFEQEVNVEDMVVSTLIAVAPERIHIHTREPESPIVGTISQIFEGRSSVCEGCRLCRLRLGERREGRHDLLPHDRLST